MRPVLHAPARPVLTSAAGNVHVREQAAPVIPALLVPGVVLLHAAEADAEVAAQGVGLDMKVAVRLLAPVVWGELPWVGEAAVCGEVVC